MPDLLPGAVAAAFLAAVLAAIYLVRYCHRPASWSKTVVKTASVLLLGLAAWIELGPSALIVALLLCALGDYLLSHDSEPLFMAGVGAFAAGHIAYVWLFLTHDQSRPDTILHATNREIIVALLVLGLLMAAVLWRRAGAMRGPVMGYIPVILSMGVAVLAVPPEGALGLAFFAAALFILSDTVLSTEMFILDDDHPAGRFTPFVVWGTYWVAQFGFFMAFTGASVG